MDDEGTTAPVVVDDLRGLVRGTVATAADVGFEDARTVWNGMIDRRPLAVVRVGDEDDIATAISYARTRGLPLAVRGGGHGVSGNGTVESGIVIDLGSLNEVEVDAAAATVRVGGGATISDVDQVTIPHGLAVPLGVISRTGVGGLTLGGGVGWLTRAHGLAADNLLEARVVTADGTRVVAGEAGDPELLWGLRGGGGNFGVVSSFTFRAHPLPDPVLAVNFVYGEPSWRQALTAWEEWTRDLPDAMQSIITVVTPPAFFGLGDDPVILVALAWVSPDRAEGERLVEQLRAQAPPDGEETDTSGWVGWQSAVDPLVPWGSRAYWKNTSFDRLDDEVIDVILRRGAEQRWVGTAFDIHHMGGAFARVAEEATPFPARSARFWLNIYGFWTDAADDAHHTAFVKGFAQDMAPFATGGLYVNFMGHDDDTDWRAAALAVYGPDKLERLVALKRRYDPDNLFRLNHNIPPG
ncbi:FAD-binding oxidoreductase [Georgenia subflava]|uniref:FAD-binding protein n=1 Tax=Georgenia subflava TaxID=1622177 RepID=A0A6N7EHT5_9MICO|nr:FAD-binding oxidoreductase [Georgenia subflava]MPV36205.1 FAD-binding protein [Georgenia subflava]